MMFVMSHKVYVSGRVVVWRRLPIAKRSQRVLFYEAVCISFSFIGALQFFDITRNVSGDHRCKPAAFTELVARNERYPLLYRVDEGTNCQFAILLSIR